MKNASQIRDFVGSHSFSDEEWEKVLGFLEGHSGMDGLERARNAEANATFGDFEEWIGKQGFGVGDCVEYGNSKGIVGSVTDEAVFLSVYENFDKGIVFKDKKEEMLEVKFSDKQGSFGRLRHLEETEEEEFAHRIALAGKRFSTKDGTAVNVYTPSKKSYFVLRYKSKREPCVGIYNKREPEGHRCLCLLKGRKPCINYLIRDDYPIFDTASQEDVHRLHDALNKNGYSFNARTFSITKLFKKGRNNIYWYINDRFEVVKDIDNGTARHTERYKAHNYFTDYGCAVTTMGKIMEIVEGEV